MTTKFNIGDTVFLKCTVDAYSITGDEIEVRIGGFGREPFPYLIVKEDQLFNHVPTRECCCEGGCKDER